MASEAAVPGTPMAGSQFPQIRCCPVTRDLVSTSRKVQSREPSLRNTPIAVGMPIAGHPRTDPGRDSRAGHPPWVFDGEAFARPGSPTKGPRVSPRAVLRAHVCATASLGTTWRCHARRALYPFVIETRVARPKLNVAIKIQACKPRKEAFMRRVSHF